MGIDLSGGQVVESSNLAVPTKQFQWVTIKSWPFFTAQNSTEVQIGVHNGLPLIENQSSSRLSSYLAPPNQHKYLYRFLKHQKTKPVKEVASILSLTGKIG